MNDHAHKILAGISALTGTGALFNWLVAHGPALISYAGGLAAIIAAVFSIASSKAQRKYWTIKRERLEDE